MSSPPLTNYSQVHKKIILCYQNQSSCSKSNILSSYLGYRPLGSNIKKNGQVMTLH